MGAVELLVLQLSVRIIAARVAPRSISSSPIKRVTSWYVDVSGAFTSTRGGLRRTDTLWKSLGKAAALKTEATVF